MAACDADRLTSALFDRLAAETAWQSKDIRNSVATSISALSLACRAQT
jgi:hypothetical protein